jgi:hypothetical protein
MQQGTTPPSSSRKRRPLRLPWAVVRSWKVGWLWLQLLVVGVCGGEPAAKEYQVKAAFLYNFAKFVEWPSQSFPDATTPITVGILGENPFGDELEKLAGGRRINGRTILVKQVQSAAAARGAHILFVSAGEDGRFAALKDGLGPVLTVGESDAFSRRGGMINFVFEGEKIRFEINVGQAEAAGLRISAQLQKLATRVWRKS